MIDRAYAGTRVIEIASGLSAGVAGRFFAELGADVVRVEAAEQAQGHPGERPVLSWARARKRILSISAERIPGIDDLGPNETFSTADAVTVLHWAQHQRIGLISFWALQRDNGGCPSTKGAGTCSGVTQPDWYFSHVFEPFTR